MTTRNIIALIGVVALAQGIIFTAIKPGGLGLFIAIGGFAVAGVAGFDVWWPRWYRCCERVGKPIEHWLVTAREAARERSARRAEARRKKLPPRETVREIPPQDIQTPTYVAVLPLPKPKRSTSLIGGLGGVALFLALGYFAIAYVRNSSVSGPLADILAGDHRNEGIRATAYYEGLLSNTLVFDLLEVRNKAPLDIMRVLIQFASAVKEKRFDVVKLAFQGRVKFLVIGDYFHEIGREFGIQNPVYTIRTFPEHVYRPDGSQAFGRWEGGILGVLAKQMEDATDFVNEWCK